MRHVIRSLVTIAAFLAASSAVQAETGTLEVTVTFRERIALPPDAQLDVQLLDVSRADAAATRIASQRFAMTTVPMTVTLIYDPEIIDAQSSYAVVAGIWSGDDQIFGTTSRYTVLDGPDAGAVDILLSMMAEEGAAPTPPGSIAGIQWTATQVAGAPWGNDDPATIEIDDEMNFAIFGGCNRFSGQLTLADGEIAFPENFAGTLMACPPDTEALERGFLAALRGVSRYVLDESGLVMTDAEGNVLLQFEQRPK